MYKNLTPLNIKNHLNLKVNAVSGYAFAKNIHLSSVVLHEFPECAANYPIVFIKKDGTDQFQPVALLGLEAGVNLFVDSAGAWQEGAYVPGAFRRYPFCLAKSPDQEGLIICFDSDSQNLNQELGEPLFGSDGTETDFFKKIRSFLTELYNSELLVEKFTAQLQKLDLLVPGNLQVTTSNGSNRFDGVFLIDENRLSQLNDAQFLSLREHGFLTAIYTHLISLLQIKKFSVKK